VYRIELLPSAAKALSRLDRSIQVRIARRIDRLAKDPRNDSLKLRGSEDIWRARVGDYRVLYRIEDDRLLVLIVRIAHRRGVYR
jgi:mRNA interferase RelE/StbE